MMMPSDRVLFELVGDAGVSERGGHPGKSNPVNLNSPQPSLLFGHCIPIQDNRIRQC